MTFFFFLVSNPHSVIIRNDVKQVMTSEFDIDPVLCQCPHMIVQITKTSTLFSHYYTNKLTFLYSYGCGFVPQLVHGWQTLTKSRFVRSYVPIWHPLVIYIEQQSIQFQSRGVLHVGRICECTCIVCSDTLCYVEAARSCCIRVTQIGLHVSVLGWREPNTT